uniref:Uncharacterized protein n=1 Tax=viral metagenome TaxID=1070528 RepID=A0A6C0C8E6_9ZZZZ
MEQVLFGDTLYVIGHIVVMFFVNNNVPLK